MSLVLVGSAKGAPGVTTAALALAVGWPAAHPLVVAELDPDGGDTAVWHGLPSSPGLVTCAAAGRRGLEPMTVWEHAQPLSVGGSVRLLAGPPSAERARAALAALCEADVGSVLGDLWVDGAPATVLADCGRLLAGSPALTLAAAASGVLLVARSSAAQVEHARECAETLSALAPTRLLLVGGGPYPPGEVAAAVGLRLAGVLADDPRAAAAVAGERHTTRSLARSRLVASARPLAARLVHARGRTPQDGPQREVGACSRGVEP